MKIAILYEDKNFVAVDKPAGLIVHPDGKNNENALTDWILKKYPKMKNIGEPIELADGEVIPRPGIVHRIDRETSGVIVIAKNQRAYAMLKKQFQRHEVRKTYFAFVHGIFVEREGRIDRPIGRSKSDFRKWSAERGVRGETRDALTYYRVVKNLPDHAFLEIRPYTGRTHQIRVHLKALGRPIVGDSLYAPQHMGELGFKRLALHAFSIEFRDIEGKMVKVEAPVPEDFAKAMRRNKVKIA